MFNADSLSVQLAKTQKALTKAKLRLAEAEEKRRQTLAQSAEVADDFANDRITGPFRGKPDMILDNLKDILTVTNYHIGEIEEHIAYLKQKASAIQVSISAREQEVILLAGSVSATESDTISIVKLDHLRERMRHCDSITHKFLTGKPIALREQKSQELVQALENTPYNTSIKEACESGAEAVVQLVESGCASLNDVVIYVVMKENRKLFIDLVCSDLPFTEETATTIESARKLLRISKAN